MLAIFKSRFLFAWILLLSFIVPNYAVTASSVPITSTLNLNQTEYLHQQPHKFKNDGRPKATAGILLYTYSEKGDAYILLGRERIDGNDKSSAGTYSEFSGSMELIEHGRSETFLEGCLRECREETAYLYDLDANYVLSHGYFYFLTKPAREIALIVIEAPFYISPAELIQKCKISNNVHSQDKDDFKWVKASNIIGRKPSSSGTLAVEDLQGRQTIIRLRSFFLEYLNDPEFIKIIKHIEQRM